MEIDAATKPMSGVPAPGQSNPLAGPFTIQEPKFLHCDVSKVDVERHDSLTREDILMTQNARLSTENDFAESAWKVLGLLPWRV